MSILDGVFPLLLALGAFTLSSPALARAIAATPSLWKADPLSAFVLSEALEEDRNGDGQPDLWREYFPKTRSIRSLQMDTTYKNGKPNLWYTYDPTGKLVRVEEETRGDGVKDRVTEFSSDAKGRAITLLRSGIDARGKASSEEVITVGAGASRLHHLRLGNAEFAYQEGPESTLDGHSVGSALAQCPFNGVPAVGFDAATARQLTDRLAGKVAVNGNCTGTPGNTPAGVPPAVALTAQMVTDTLREGLACLRNQGPNGTRMADEMLANALATNRQLVINCEMPPSPCLAKNADQCGKASHFDEPDFPRIHFNRNCFTNANGSENQGERKRIVFHEMLHLAGTCGHQHLHGYANALHAEVVEPCAQCCMGTPGVQNGVNAREVNCSLCNQSYPNVGPASNALRSFDALYATGNYQAALNEAQKAVMLEPNEKEGWVKLTMAIYKINSSISGLPAPLKALLYLANEKTRALFSKDHEDRDGRAGMQFLRSSSWAGYYTVIRDQIRADYAAKMPGAPEALVGQRLQYDAQKELFRMLITGCGPMASSDGPTPEERQAKNCFDQAQRAIRGMQTQVTAMESVVSPETLTSLNANLTRYRSGIGCLTTPPARTNGQCFPNPKASPQSPVPAPPGGPAPAAPNTGDANACPAEVFI